MAILSNVGWDQSRRAGTPAHNLTRGLGGPALALLANPTLRCLILSSRFKIPHLVAELCISWTAHHEPAYGGMDFSRT